MNVKLNLSQMNTFEHQTLTFCTYDVCMSQFRERVEFSKLNCGESVDVYLKKDVRKRSYASLVTQRKRETPAVDISVSGQHGWLEGYAYLG